MNAELEKLIALEQTDKEILRLREEVTDLPRRVAAIEGKLAEITSQVEKSKQDIKNQEVDKRKLEADIKDHQGKISKFRSQALEVKNNEQYRALMHEIEFAEQAIRSSEDKILEAMLRAESLEVSQKAGESEMKAQRAAVEKEKILARERTAVDEKLLAELAGRAQSLRPGIEGSVLAHYDRLMRQRKSAIAEALAESCVACHVLLRPQKYNDIRTNEQIITCDSCGRILYYDPAHEPPPPPVKPSAKIRKANVDAQAEAARSSDESPAETPATQ